MRQLITFANWSNSDLATQSCISYNCLLSIRAAHYDAGRCNASLGLGGRVALAYPEWASPCQRSLRGRASVAAHVPVRNPGPHLACWAVCPLWARCMSIWHMNVQKARSP